jgi:redox-sensitive bicupin YhaK (pirin superfamily)
MRSVRRAAERGRTALGWLDSKHTFSFGEYYDPAHMGFRALRVINDDVVAGGRGFAPHSHRDMEILSYIVAGELEHRDSLGTGSVIHAGEVQRMSAGTGVTHSEYNHSQTSPVRFLQIWILPERQGLEPGYEQRRFGGEGARDRLQLVASRSGRDGSVTVHQDVDVYLSMLGAGGAVAHALRDGRYAWAQVVRGDVEVETDRLVEGDGIAISGERSIRMRSDAGGEVLLFELG